MKRGELFQRVNQKFIHVGKPCVSGPKGLVQCSCASNQSAIIPVTPGLPKLPAHPLGMSSVHWNFWPVHIEEWVNGRKLWQISRWEGGSIKLMGSITQCHRNGFPWLCSQAFPCKSCPSQPRAASFPRQAELHLRFPHSSSPKSEMSLNIHF